MRALFSKIGVERLSKLLSTGGVVLRACIRHFCLGCSFADMRERAPREPFYYVGIRRVKFHELFQDWLVSILFVYVALLRGWRDIARSVARFAAPYRLVRSKGSLPFYLYGRTLWSKISGRIVSLGSWFGTSRRCLASLRLGIVFPFPHPFALSSGCDSTARG